MRRVAVVVLFGVLGFSGQALAEGQGGDSVTIHVTRKAHVGQTVRATFSGKDNPLNQVGTFLDAVLEPPLNRGGSPCRANGLGETEQNHPKSQQLLMERKLDYHHHGRFRITLNMPVFNVGGTWTLCVWQYNNDQLTNYGAPASEAEAHIEVAARRVKR